MYAPAHGPLVVGRDAALLARDDPARFEPCPKRRVDDGTVLLGEREVPVTDLLTAILVRVGDEARRVAGTLPPAVLTCPAAWGRRRRDLLTAAAVAAGLTVTAMLTEPTAAAAYFTTVLGHDLRTGQALAVFDVGGGTVDVTVVRRVPDGMRVVATGGLDDLGGIDLDALVVEHVGAGRPDVASAGPDDLRRRDQFWQDARHAREMLSRSASAPLHVPGAPGATHVTRTEFERWAAPVLRRAVEEASRTLARAGLAPGELAGVFLVGGASRTPLVGRLLHQTIGIAPTVLEQPETAVAEGAARSGPQVAPEVAGLPAVPPVPPSVPEPEAPQRRRYGPVVAGALLALLAAVLLVAFRPWQHDARPPVSEGGPTPSASPACPSVQEARDALKRSGNLAKGVTPAIADDPKCRGGYALVVFATQSDGGVDPGGNAILHRTGGRWVFVVSSTDLCGGGGPDMQGRPDWADGLPDDVLTLAGCDPADYTD
ncbi:Hsp70 family protein [Actinocatenispora rupis]|uniref:Hsp70 protein n=1 Tax=Actinocatenispora rupis TaxID=519421 RepID=A0A8J3JD07_9ACTN|nr:Hsp70 family protein [Actinocatenispora rupis]GID16081.1 hypothetical protein Aru02nite_69700 [Actinocatenispora rupis]